MAFGLSAAAVGLIGTGVGAAVGLYGANSAADAQADASASAGQISQAQYNQTRADQLAAAAQARTDQAPYRDAGTAALSQLVGGTTGNSDLTRAFTMADYQADPGYAFRLSQGQAGINAAASAQGSRYSGATLKALDRFNSNEASQEYGAAEQRFTANQGNTFNRLSSLAGTGQTAVAGTTSANTTATNALTSAGTANATAQGTAAQNAAAATASGYVGTANAINGTIGSLVNQYNLSSLTGSGASSYNPYATPTGAVANVLY